MIVDAHLHIGLNGWSEEVLMKYLDANGIEKAWILTWDEESPAIPIYYQPLDLELVIRIYQKYPDRILPFYAPDPIRKDWKERFEYALENGIAGCGELKVALRWNDPVMIPLLEYLDDRKLPLIFHMEQGRKLFIPVRERGADWLFKRLINERFNGKMARFILKMKDKPGFLKNYLESRLSDFGGYLMNFKELEDAVGKYRNINFIAHGPHIWNHFSVPNKGYLFHQTGPYRGKGNLWKLLADYDNFYTDLSGFSGLNAMKRNRKASREFLDTYHHKLLFGSDNTGNETLELIKSFALEDTKLRNILSENAEKIVLSAKSK